MDLHDFDDVAMNYDYFLPEVTKGSSYLKNFEEFHSTLAEKYGKGGVLDIAYGTGALTIPLAKTGYAAYLPAGNGVPVLVRRAN